MLSLQLQRTFAALGARLKVHTEPKESFVRLALRQDEQGDFFRLVLPRMSRRLISLLAFQPRRKRLLLRLGSGTTHAYVLVQMQPKLSLRTLKRRQAKRLMAAAGLGELPQVV